MDLKIMQNFKSYLNEEKTFNEIIEVLFKFNIIDRHNVKVTSNNKIDVNSEYFLFTWNKTLVDIVNEHLPDMNFTTKKLPVQFNKCAQHISITGNELTSTWGFPNEAENFTLKSESLTSLQGLEGNFRFLDLDVTFLKSFDCNVNVCKLFFYNTNFFDVKDFNKSFHKLNAETFEISLSNSLSAILYKQPLLSFLKGSIEEINTDSLNANTPEDMEIYKVMQIINKYLPNGNVLKCQRELIQNGFKDYAKF